MIKFTVLLRRKPSMTHDEFVAYHRERHAPLFCALPAVRQHVRRYVQCHTVADHGNDPRQNLTQGLSRTVIG